MISQLMMVRVLTERVLLRLTTYYKWNVQLIIQNYWIEVDGILTTLH